MKKTFILCLMVTFFVGILQPLAYSDFADDFAHGYNIGASIRRDIERARAERKIMNGVQSQDIFVDKHFNFSKIKKVIFTVRAAKGSEEYIDDPYIIRTYRDELEEAFRGKDITFESANSAERKLLIAYPTWPSMADNMKYAVSQKFVNENYQAVLTVTFGSYSQTNESNVALNYLIRDTVFKKDIFNDRDIRLHVLNKTKRKLLDDMTTKFKNEFFKAVNNSK